MTLKRYKKMYCVQDVTHDTFAQIFTSDSPPVLYTDKDFKSGLQGEPDNTTSHFICHQCASDVFLFDDSEDILLAFFIDIERNNANLAELLDNLPKTTVDSVEKADQFRLVAQDLLGRLPGVKLFNGVVSNRDLAALRQQVEALFSK